MKNFNLTLKFLLPILVAFVLIAVLLGYQAGVLIKKAVVNQTVGMAADFIRISTLKHVVSSSDFSFDNPQRTEQLFGEVSKEIKTDRVVRIKVWNKKEAVIFSDDKSIVGQTFADNEELKESMEGEVKVEIKNPLGRENVSEQGYRQAMEVYVPIFLEGQTQPEGVVEIYYNMDDLNASIRKIQLQIILINLGAFIILAAVIALLFHFLIVKPLKGLEVGMMEIQKKGL